MYVLNSSYMNQKKAELKVLFQPALLTISFYAFPLLLIGNRIVDLIILNDIIPGLEAPFLKRAVIKFLFGLIVHISFNRDFNIFEIGAAIDFDHADCIIGIYDSRISGLVGKHPVGQPLHHRALAVAESGLPGW